MQKILTTAIFGLLIAVSAPAAADTFVWQDPRGDYTMSFPDTWRIQTEDTPSTMLRIAGPLAEDNATCRMQVDADGRLKIYPKRLTDEAVVETLDQDFYDQQVAQHPDSRVIAYYAPASMGGKGDATAVQYVFNDDGNPMYGVMIGSIYGGKRYVANCSSKMEVYDRWSPVFASILDSVELKSKYHPFAIGYYRDFLMDPKLVLPRTKPGTVGKNTFRMVETEYNK